MKANWAESSTGSALPIVIRPQPRELLLGLLLNADAALVTPAGSVAGMVKRHDTNTLRFGRPSLSVLATTFDLEALAVLLDVPLAEVRATTYIEELTRLFGPTVSPLRLGISGPLAICPRCIKESRLISRDTLLPMVHGCPRHHLWHLEACQCGAPLVAFSGGDPFSCLGCGRAWDSLPELRLGPVDDLRQRRIVHAFRVLLERGGRDVFARAQAVLALDDESRWDTGWCSNDDPEVNRHAMSPKDMKSLASVVANLILREIPPERLFESEPQGRHPELVCRNRACPAFGSSVSTRVSARRRNGIESYCAECGSRFLGSRTILSFDRDNGSPDLSPIVVKQARARLADYHARIASACDFLLFARDERDRLTARRDGRVFDPVHIDHVFHMAAVPMASYLRARRLGLVALIVQRLGDVALLRRPRIILDDLPPLFDPSPRWTYPSARLSLTGQEAKGCNGKRRTLESSSAQRSCPTGDRWSPWPGNPCR